MNVNMEDLMLYLSIKYNGDFNTIYNALMNNEKTTVKAVEDCKKLVHCKYTTIVSKDYPDALRGYYYPPIVVFYQGDLNALDARCARDFRSIDGKCRIYYNDNLMAAENMQDLSLVASIKQELSIRKAAY